MRRAVVCRLASLGHDVVAMVRDVPRRKQALPSGIALRVADYEDASALKSVPSQTSGELVLPTGHDRFAPISRDDVAAAVAAVAAKPNNLPYPVGYASTLGVRLGSGSSFGEHIFSRLQRARPLLNRFLGFRFAPPQALVRSRLRR